MTSTDAPSSRSKSSPFAPLSEAEWIPRNRHAPLVRLGIETLGDLLTHYPRRHEDRRAFDRFPDQESDQPVCVCGIVTKAALKRFKGWQKSFEATLEDVNGGLLGGTLTCRWFNMHYVQKMIATGSRMVVYGKPKERAKRIVMDHPEFEMIEEDAGERSIHLERITPVHPAGDGINPRALRVLIHEALERVQLEEIPSLLPDESGGMRYAEALRAIHFPEDFEELESARKRIVSEEFFGMQALIASRRARRTSAGGVARRASGELMEKFHASLPFALTGAQQRTIAEIRGDLNTPARMNRLLQGDVGSGKTLVALSAMLLAVEAKWQAAIMAPTQILAEQHYLNFQRLLAPLGISVALKTGSRKEGGATPLFGDPQIIVGTHALLYEDDVCNNLGLIVIDEQHKFGVLQRARLIERGSAPDVLVMTATPIPRTLTQTIYGDLDISVLDEKPAERGKIITAVRDDKKLPEIVEFLRTQLAEGRQAYIVYPLVEESEKLEARAATEEFEKWQPLLAPHKVGLVHGRMPPEAKDLVMAQFRAGEVSALVATTVIEVGVDVPNASFMLIENAERFGLSQLHQLRGRIGRGAHKSWCVLLQGPKPGESGEKLRVLEKTSDGFEVAEADLQLRGPGDLTGTAQTGLPPLKIADLLRDGQLMSDARKAAQILFEKDPGLAKPEHAAIRRYIERQSTRVAAAAG